MPLALLGTLSLLQIVFLPGYLLLRALRMECGTIATAVFSFALSLLANFCMVALLTAFGAYRPGVIYCVFAAELACWLSLDYRSLGARLCDSLRAARHAARSFAGDLDKNNPIRSAWLRRSLIVAALAVIIGFAVAGLAETGRIFDQWDAVVSWNRWAIDWSANRLPEVTSYYPQLLPANISLTYVFMQSSEIWMFAKAFQFLFCLMLLLAMLDAARRPGNSGLVPGLVINYALLVALLRYRLLASGYADAPLAMFAWLPIYALIRAQATEEERESVRWIIVGALMAVGGALTKQIGLYIAVVYPLLAWLACGGRLAARLRVLAYVLCLIAILVGPWYLYKIADIHAGHDADNTPQLVHDFHDGRGVGERLVYARHAVADALTLPGCVLLCVALAASLSDRRSRQLLLLFVAPLGLVWAAGFSYDLRNLAILAPFVGAAAGAGCMRIVCWEEAVSMLAVGCVKRAITSRVVRSARTSTSQDTRAPVKFARATHQSESPCSTHPTSRFDTVQCGHVAALVVLILVATAFSTHNHTLLDSQHRQERQRVGIVSLNDQLYSFAEAHAKGELIATDYLAMRWLPDLAARRVVCTCHELRAFRQTFDLPNVRYILVRTGGQAADVRAFLARPGAVRLLFEDHGFAFYEKLGVSCYN